MNVRKFSAPSSRAALHAVKKELGPEAVILSNRSVEGGVEIVAMVPEASPQPRNSTGKEESTDKKTSLNEALREHSIAV